MPISKALPRWLQLITRGAGTVTIFLGMSYAQIDLHLVEGNAHQKGMRTGSTPPDIGIVCRGSVALGLKLVCRDAASVACSVSDQASFPQPFWNLRSQSPDLRCELRSVRG